MAVSYGSSGVRSNKAAVATTDTVTPALPTGVAAGDLLVIFASSFRDATTFSADQSYVNTRQNTKIAILEKTAGGSEVAPTVTFGGLTVGDLISAVIMRFPGGAATKDWSNVTGAMSATTLPGPPLTVTDTGSVGVVIGYQPNDKTGATFTANSWTEREYSTTTTGTDGTHYVATQDGLASGSQTMPIWTWVGSLEYRAISFSVPPGTGDQTITGALFNNSNTFFGATVSRGAVSIAGSLYSDVDAFYGATVGASYAIAGDRFDNSQTFYQATVTPGPVVISGALYTNGQTFFGATISIDGGAQNITAALFTNVQSFFGATVSVVAPTKPEVGGGAGRTTVTRTRAIYKRKQSEIPEWERPSQPKAPIKAKAMRRPEAETFEHLAAKPLPQVALADVELLAALEAAQIEIEAREQEAIMLLLLAA